jgi:hypothetical protein
LWGKSLPGLVDLRALSISDDSSKLIISTNQIFPMLINTTTGVCIKAWMLNAPLDATKNNLIEIQNEFIDSENILLNLANELASEWS